MTSPIGIMPDSLIDRTKRTAAFNWLIAQPLPGPYKVQLWQGWANVVLSGVALREIQLLHDSAPQ